MITKTGVITTVENALDLLKNTNLSDKLLIDDDVKTDMVTIGDFIERLKQEKSPKIPKMSIVIGHKSWKSPEMEVLISCVRDELNGTS